MNKPFGDDQQAFDNDVLLRKCPTCKVPRNKGCVTKTGKPLSGPFAAKFHMPRVALAGYWGK